jgi:hypothetical protein
MDETGTVDTVILVCYIVRNRSVPTAGTIEDHEEEEEILGTQTVIVYLGSYDNHVVSVNGGHMEYFSKRKVKLPQNSGRNIGFFQNSSNSDIGLHTLQHYPSLCAFVCQVF